MKIVEPGFKRIINKTYKYILLCVLIPIVCFTILYQSRLVLSEKHRMESENRITAQSCMSVLDDLWHTGSTISYSLLSSSDTISFSNKDRTTLSGTMVKRFSDIRQQLACITAYTDYVSDAVMIFHDPTYYLHANGGYIKLYDNNRATIQTNSSIDYATNYITDETKDGWYANRNLLYFYLSQSGFPKQPVSCLLAFNLTEITQQLKALLNDSGLLLLDADGNPLMSIGNTADAPSTTGIAYLDGEWKHIIHITSDVSGWTITLSGNEARFNEALHNAITQCLLILVLLIVLGALVAFIITMSVCRPYKAIAQLLSTPVQDSVTLESYAEADDLGIIRDLISESKYRLYAAQNEMNSSRQLLKSAQFLALQAQINPHFIHNTLETINWKVLSLYKGKPNEISDMICDLSQLMRLSIKTDDTPIPLRNEIEHAKVYLRIQQKRFPDKFDVTWDIPEKYLDTLVVALTLQPLLENAISHGIKPANRHGTIDIRADEVDGKLRISVSDDGIGFSADALKKAQQMLAESVLHTNEHVGLFNVNQRLKLAFPDKASLTIDSTPGKGCRITMYLPL